MIFYKAGIDDTGRLLTQDEYDALNSYIESGGNLIVTGPSILTGSTNDDTPDDYLAADLVGSATVGAGMFADYWITNNDNNGILNGPFGDVRNTKINYGASVEHDQMIADVDRGAYSLGTFDDGAYDKATLYRPGCTRRFRRRLDRQRALL